MFAFVQAELHKLVGQADESEVYVRVQALCDTLRGNPVPVVTVTAQPDDSEESLSEFCECSLIGFDEFLV